MKTIRASVNGLPDQVQRWIWMHGLAGLGIKASLRETVQRGTVLLDSVGHFVFDTDGLYPAIAMLDGKQYFIDLAPRPNQDASDLPLYEEVLLQAYRGEVKSAATCYVVTKIQTWLIAPKLARIIALTKTGNSSDAVYALRGEVERAKFTAVTIWREGKKRKDGGDDPNKE